MREASACAFKPTSSSEGVCSWERVRISHQLEEGAGVRFSGAWYLSVCWSVFSTPPPNSGASSSLCLRFLYESWKTFAYSFKGHLLNTSHVPGTILGAGDTLSNQVIHRFPEGTNYGRGEHKENNHTVGCVIAK